MPSCIRGYHVQYMYVGEILSSKKQPLNVKDRYAVSTHKGMEKLSAICLERFLRFCHYK